MHASRRIWRRTRPAHRLKTPTATSSFAHDIAQFYSIIVCKLSELNIRLGPCHNATPISQLMVRTIMYCHERAQLLSSSRPLLQPVLAGSEVTAEQARRMLDLVSGHRNLHTHRRILKRALRGKHDNIIEAIQSALEDCEAITTDSFTASEPKKIDPHAAIRRLASARASFLKHWRIRLRIKLCTGSPALVAVESEFKRILSNLVENASEALPYGGHITISTRRIRSSMTSYKLVVSIIDTGAGMPPNVLDDLFCKPVSTKGAKRGIGLLSVKRFVHKNGGEISVESKIGKGTSFHVTFPCD